MSGGFRKRFGGNKGSEPLDSASSEAAAPEKDSGVDNQNEDAAARKELLETIANLEAEKKELERKFAVSVADGRNIMTRAEAMIAQNRLYALSDFMKDFIDPLENLMIVFDNTPDTDVDAGLTSARQAMEMVVKKFFTVLSKHGINRVCPVGEKFDHNFHQAVSTQKAEEGEEGVIIKVLKAGYVMNDRVLSPALVVVCQ